MKIVDKISIKELKEMANKMFGNMVKADVDIVKKIVIVDMELHADGEAKLLEDGSRQNDLWGINLHPDIFGKDDFIEFDSMINIRPSQKNMSRGVEDLEVRRKIKEIVNEVVHE